MAKEKNAIEKELTEWFSKAERTVIAGVGNPIRTDDFVGIKIVQDLNGKLPKKVLLLECETVPESFLQDIIDFKPTHVLLIDAAIMGLKPGEARLLSQENITGFSTTSTHTLPLRIFCEYLEATTKSKIALLLIEPKNVEFGEGLTPELQESEKKIAKTLLNLLS